MKFARRIEQLPPYLFVEISRKIAQKRAEGIDVVTFAIGDPDIPTPSHILDRLQEASQDPPNHRYPESEGLPELRRAVAQWYEERFGVTLDSDKEILPLIGAKEGIGHARSVLHRPRRRGPSPGPRLPGLLSGNHVRRRRVPLDAPGGGESMASGPEGHTVGGG